MLTLLCMLVSFLIVIDTVVMFSSSKDDTPAGTLAPRWPFSQLALLAHQLRTPAPLISRAVQVASVRMSSSLSRSGPEGKARPGKFNFRVGTGEVDESSGDGGLEAA